jgi:hypothetical protein
LWVVHAQGGSPLEVSLVTALSGLRVVLNKKRVCSRRVYCVGMPYEPIGRRVFEKSAAWENVFGFCSQTSERGGRQGRESFDWSGRLSS